MPDCRVSMALLGSRPGESRPEPWLRCNGASGHAQGPTIACGAPGHQTIQTSRLSSGSEGAYTYKMFGLMVPK